MPSSPALTLDRALAFSRYAAAALAANPDERDALSETLAAPYRWAGPQAELEACVAAGDGPELAKAGG